MAVEESHSLPEVRVNAHESEEREISENNQD